MNKCPFTGKTCIGIECKLWNERLEDCIFNKMGVSSIQTAFNTQRLTGGYNEARKQDQAQRI